MMIMIINMNYDLIKLIIMILFSWWWQWLIWMLKILMRRLILGVIIQKYIFSKFDMNRLLGYIWDKGNSEKKVFHFQCCQTFSVNFSLENDLYHKFTGSRKYLTLRSKVLLPHKSTYLWTLCPNSHQAFSTISFACKA